MLLSFKHLRGYALHATDGEIGSVYAAYFDDRSWDVRYIVVETGNWFTRRKVLIAPVALGVPDWKAQTIPVLLTREQVKNSPSIDLNQPVSRQMEHDLHSYYNWVPYWQMGAGVMGSGAIAAAIAMSEREKDSEAQDKASNPHLRSTRELVGYTIKTEDGEACRLADFIVDDKMWRIHYIVAQLDDKKHIFAPQWIKDINWTRENVSISLDTTAINLAPEFDPEEPVNREYEVRLYDYYGRPKYWERL